MPAASYQRNMFRTLVSAHSLKEIGLDVPKGDLFFLSHAHRDHTTGFSKKKKIERLIATDETIDLAGLNARKEIPKYIKLYEAGHILGSRQIGMETEFGYSVYTGDISLKENIFGEKAEIVECDHLIIEATYGNPRYVLPNPFDVYQEIADWVRLNEDKNLIIGAYSLGKAQEIIKVLNSYSGIAPVVTEDIEEFNKIYEKHGKRLDRVVVGSDEAEETMKHRFVAVVPMKYGRRWFARRLEDAFSRRTLSSLATGWGLEYSFNSDKVFLLSDHADHNDLKEYIFQSGASKVEFFCGDGSSLVPANIF